VQLFTKERVIYVGLCAHARTIRSYAPEALTIRSDGDGSVDAKVIVSKLFRYPPPDKVEVWFKEGLVNLLMPPDEQDPLDSIQDAVKMTGMTLVRSKGMHPDAVSKEMFYVATSPLTSGKPKAFLVMVGHLKNVPKEITQVSLG